MKGKDCPVLLAEEGKGGDWFVWCPFCKTNHHHSKGEGSRVAHCTKETPFKETGYILKLKEQAKKKL